MVAPCSPCLGRSSLANTHPTVMMVMVRRDRAWGEEQKPERSHSDPPWNPARENGHCGFTKFCLGTQVSQVRNKSVGAARHN